MTGAELRKLSELVLKVKLKNEETAKLERQRLQAALFAVGVSISDLTVGRRGVFDMKFSGAQSIIKEHVKKIRAERAAAFQEEQQQLLQHQPQTKGDAMTETEEKKAKRLIREAKEKEVAAKADKGLVKEKARLTAEKARPKAEKVKGKEKATKTKSGNGKRGRASQFVGQNYHCHYKGESSSEEHFWLQVLCHHSPGKGWSFLRGLREAWRPSQGPSLGPRERTREGQVAR